MKSLNLLLTALLLAPLYLVAQPNFFQLDKLTIEDGLSQSTVNCILKDSRGFMWFGTNDGLNRYDGYNFTIFRHDANDSTSLTNNKIYALVEDENGNLWVGTRDGLNYFNREKEEFQSFQYFEKSTNTVRSTIIRSLYLDGNSLWIGTLGDGLMVYDRQQNSLLPYEFHLVEGLPQNFHLNTISTIQKGERDEILLGGNFNGLIYLDKKTKKLRIDSFGIDLEEENSTGKKIYRDSNQNIWVCSEGNGLYMKEKGKSSFRHFVFDSEKNSLSSNIVKDIFEDSEGFYWIATDGGGLNILDLENEYFTHYKYEINQPSELLSNAIYVLYPDNEQNVWIGTFGAGINIFNTNRKPFNHFTQNGSKTGLSHNSVLSFVEDKDGMIWVGTDGGGLNLFDRKKGQFQSFHHDISDAKSLSSNAITSLYRDKLDNLWIGTYSGGLNLFNRNNQTFQHFINDPKDSLSLGNNNVWSIFEDSQNRLWIGTLGGLYLMNREKGEFERFWIAPSEDISEVTRITCLMESQDGKLWVGGDGVFVYDFEEKVWSSFMHDANAKNSLGIDDVRDIFQDSRGNIWVSTEGGGLNLFDPHNQGFRKFTYSDGLPNNAVHQVLEDREGNLWLSTNFGLSKFVNGVSTPSIPVFRNYSLSDGLQSNQFSYSAALATSTGEMYFGGVNGFNVFYPHEIRENQNTPPVYITGLKINEQEVIVGKEGSPLKKQIGESDKLILSYDQSRVFSLEFTALNFIASEKNQYAFMLEGFREEWSYVENQRIATYTNLDAGDYVFRVKASNNDGKWNEEGAILHIRVLPPYWKTWWAYTVYGLVLVGMFYSFRRVSMERMKLKNDLKYKDMEREKVNELNQLKLRFFTNISHEFRTPLTLIVDPLKKMLDRGEYDRETRTHLLLMYMNSNRLLRLINQLMDFRKIEKGNMNLSVGTGDFVQFMRGVKRAFNDVAREHQINYTFKSNLKVAKVWFDTDKLEKVFYNLLSNAFKFTPDFGKISMELLFNEEKGMVEIYVKDSGQGIKKEKLDRVFDRFYNIENKADAGVSIEGTGIGLALTKELVSLHHGEISVESNLGDGSVFTVTLPIEKERFTSDEIQPSKEVRVQNNQMLSETFTNEFLHEEISSENQEQEQNTELPLLLIVEDNKSMRTYIRETLQDKYRIREAENGVEGWKIASQSIPDLIICDLMMPLMDGMELTRKLKNDVRTSHIPVVILTAKSSVDDNIDGFKIGADDYIAKPFNYKLLQTRVDNLINIRKGLQEKYSQGLMLSKPVSEMPSVEEDFLKKAMEIIENHISDASFDVQGFVKEIGLSRSVLYRKLKAVTGMSANEFINTIRMKRAAQLLSQNRFSVSEVAYEVGFNDPQYFSKCFRKQYGVTPSGYSASFSEDIVLKE